jgi:hypothetical protein
MRPRPTVCWHRRSSFECIRVAVPVDTGDSSLIKSRLLIEVAAPRDQLAMVWRKDADGTPIRNHPPSPTSF